MRMPGIDGVIGLNLFRSLLVTLDYPDGRFRVTGGSLPPDAIAYAAPRGVPMIEIEVNGQKMSVDVDSGSPAELSLPLSVAKTLSLGAEPAVVGRGMTADGPFDIYSAPLEGTVRAGGITLTNPRLDFVDVFPVGHLGSRFLSKLAVTFDPANHRLRFAQ